MYRNDKQVEHFGIDFGTTNIAVSGLILDKDEKKAFKVSYGEDGIPFPSIVALKDEGNIKVKFGREVKTQLTSIEEEGYKIFKSVKTAVGQDIKYEVGSYRITPTEVVTSLIKAVKEYLSNGLRRKVKLTEATIAVPVDFTSEQRSELCKAFKSAGIQVNKILSESMAAYIKNREEVAGFSRVLVFDWGGGTLDISLLEVKKGKVFEIATSGWKVAGDRIDEIIAEFVHNQLLAEGKLEKRISFNEISLNDRLKLLAECEKAKINFSDEDEIDEPQILSMIDYCGAKKVFYKLSFDDFASLIGQTISNAVGVIYTVLQKASMVLQDLNAIILVGGSSNLLPLKQIMEREFGEKKHIKIVYPRDPQWSVADGAAIIDSVNCEYALNQEINIIMSDGAAYPIIALGSRIPYKGEIVSFGTVNCASSANFIVADDKQNILTTITVPAKGFLEEFFDVQGVIGNDLIATITVNSGKNGNCLAKKEINQLSYYCDISEVEDYQFEMIKQ